MAARRALRRLSARCPLLGDPAAQSHSRESWQKSLESGRWNYHACSQGTRDREENEQQLRNKMTHPSIAGGKAMVFGNLRAAGFRGSGFAHHSVRFCSSGGAADLSDSAAPAISASSIPEVLVDAAQQVVASGVANSPSEIALAAAESFPWTAAVQYVINDIHALTGLPWWISIALTTVIIRASVIPLVVYQVKSTARFAVLRPELEKIKADMEASKYTPEAVAENKKKMAELFAKHKTDPFTPLIGALLQGPIFMCFFFGLRTMAEKMDSFKTGGAYWFTDLSTPDDLYILPLLTTLTFLITVELGAAEGMQGQPNQKMIKNVLRGMGVLFLPLTASFPKALFCYWVTSNLWSLLQGVVMRNRSVKTFLGIPDTSQLGIPRPQPIVSSKPPPRKTADDVSFDSPAGVKKTRRLAQ